VDHLLRLSTAETGQVVRFNAEARARYLQFAQSPEAVWSGNFRDLAGSITRLATLADGGRIGAALVEAEIGRLRWLWAHHGGAGRAGGVRSSAEGVAVDLSDYLDAQVLAGLDLFERLQLEAVIAVCRRSRTLSDAGRVLFDVSRTQRGVVNDADRLRKYLGRHGLEWGRVVATG
jgi:transcriptional regulatory protein RtcR